MIKERQVDGYANGKNSNKGIAADSGYGSYYLRMLQFCFCCRQNTGNNRDLSRHGGASGRRNVIA